MHPFGPPEQCSISIFDPFSSLLQSDGVLRSDHWRSETKQLRSSLRRGHAFVEKLMQAMGRHVLRGRNITYGSWEAMHVSDLDDWTFAKLILEPFSNHRMGGFGWPHHHPHEPAAEFRIGRTIVVRSISRMKEPDQLYQIGCPGPYCRLQIELVGLEHWLPCAMGWGALDTPFVGHQLIWEEEFVPAEPLRCGLRWMHPVAPFEDTRKDVEAQFNGSMGFSCGRYCVPVDHCELFKASHRGIGGVMWGCDRLFAHPNKMLVNMVRDVLQLFVHPAGRCLSVQNSAWKCFQS